MEKEKSKKSRWVKYPFATWKVGDTFSVCGWANESTDMAHRLRCAANNRKSDKSWRFATAVCLDQLGGTATVTIKRVK